MHSTLDREEIIAFFLDEYRPTPIVSPWNSSSSITSKSESKNLDDKVLALELPRFHLWNEVVAKSRQIYRQSQEIKSSERKEWILAQCRVRFPDEALDWMDATYILTSRGAKFPPMLGTGGNDGRLEFSRNFFQNIVLALNLDDKRNGDSIIRDQIVAALFDEGSPRLQKRTNGFFNPGSVGGANSSVGFSGDSLTNPWDYVLMFEGALLFAGAAARRLSPQSRTKAVFPFTVNNSAGGYGTAADSEYGDSSRAEFWAPVWDNPTSLLELSHLVSEGRAQLGRRQAGTGTDFARAVAGLGTERGVYQFHRYGFLVRNGLAYLAAPLGRFRIQQDNAAVVRANVLFDLDQWTDGLRRQLSGRNSPAGLGTALRRIDDAIIDFCQRGQPRDLQNVLIAVGHAERWVAKSSIRASTPPLDRLSWDWLVHANDNSAEFRLARALASIFEGTKDGQISVGTVRENLEPVAVRGRVEWDDANRSYVWTAGDPLSSMLAVLTRRCLDGRMTGLNHPPLDSRYSAQLKDIVAFLNGDVDYQRIADLALPLSFIRYGQRQSASEFYQAAPFDLPAAYSAMKLTLLPRYKFVCPEFQADTEIRMEPSIPALLRAGRVGDAYDRARRRLWTSGLRPLTDNPGISDGANQARHLAAALLFPLDETANNALAQRALRQPELASN